MKPVRDRRQVTYGLYQIDGFKRFGDVYYLGWQSGERVDDVSRSIFNVDVSRDGIDWERKYRFETTHSFQYAAFREADGRVYLSVTQGAHHVWPAGVAGPFACRRLSLDQNPHLDDVRVRSRRLVVMINLVQP